jgi:hypothetical protein
MSNKTTAAPIEIAVAEMRPNTPLHSSRDEDRQPHLSDSNCQPKSTLSKKNYEEYLVNSINRQENKRSSKSTSSGSNAAKHTSALD